MYITNMCNNAFRMTQPMMVDQVKREIPKMMNKSVEELTEKVLSKVESMVYEVNQINLRMQEFQEMRNQIRASTQIMDTKANIS